MCYNKRQLFAHGGRGEIRVENLVTFFKHPLEFIRDYILFPLENINPISDVLDILILTALLYFLYKFMKNRRAGKLMVGVVMILLLYLASSLLEMKATKLLLQNFFTVGIIALFIVFQPELREALEKMGNTSVNLRRFNNSIHENGRIMHAVDEIVDACCAMSRECCGALIVIDRTTGLRDFISSGTKIDAEISSYLLRNIFFNKSPLHDGAVIIQNMRIAAAKCKLPLSVNEDMVKDLGTRHRAGVGLSEVSDAVIIIVSEETGIISMANNKLIKRNYTADTLRHDLYLFLTGQLFEGDKHDGGNEAEEEQVSYTAVSVQRQTHDAANEELPEENEEREEEDTSGSV